MNTNKFSALAVAVFATGVSFAGIFDDVVFRAATNKADPTAYKANEPITLAFTLANAPKEVYSGDYSISWVRKGDDGKEEKGLIPLDGKMPMTLTTKLDRPGNVLVTAYVVDKTGAHVKRDKPAPNACSWEGGAKEVEFIGGALVEPEKLDQAHPEPEDFDAFWARQKARLAAVPMIVERVEVKPGKICRNWKVKIACAGPRPVTGYLSIPKNAKPKSLKAVCQFHGYGTGIQQAPEDGWEGVISFSVNAHGYDFDQDKAYYDNFLDGIHPPSTSYGFSTWQNEYPEGCYFNGMALRLLRAYDFVRTLPEWDGKTLEARGGSQGGLQSMWAAGLVDGLTKAYPVVPWCCDLGPDAVKDRMAPGWRIHWTKGISYYDPVNFAKRAKCFVAIERAGLGDTCCLPSSIAILYNKLAADRRSIVWVQGSKHGYVPPMPNQSVELPSGKTVAAFRGENVFVGSQLPTDPAK